MSPTLVSSLGTLLLGLLLLAPAAATEALADPPAISHPRVLLTADRRQRIRDQAAVPGSHHARALAALQARVDASDPDTLDAYSPSQPWGYRRSWYAREAACLAAIHQDVDPTTARHYAAKAWAALDAVYNGSNVDRDLVNAHGLSRAMMGMGFALVYDWCYQAWTPAERTWVHDRLMENLDMWPGFGHVNVDHPDKASNWVAVVRGGELVTLLATWQETARADRLTLTVGDLETHMANGLSDMGFTQEGYGYAEYGGQFLLTAALALRDTGDDSLAVDPAGARSWRGPMYSHAFGIQERKFLQQGVSHQSNFDEGYASLLLGLVDDADADIFRHWYDRHIGVANPLRGDASLFDHERAGTVWALAFYDPAVAASDPASELPPLLVDDHGFHVARNRWQDQHDIQISLHADVDHRNRAWDSCEVGAFSIIAYNTRFAGGPGKQTASSPAEFNLLQVDGTVPGSTATGTLVEAISLPTGGRVVVDGGSAYAGIGLDGYERQGLIDFATGGNRALFATIDRHADAEAHTLTWNLNPGAENGDLDGVVAEVAEVDGRPGFLLSGAGGSLRGIVLSPTGASVAVGAGGEPVTVTASTADEPILVAMILDDGSGTLPTISGSGLASELAWEGRLLRWDAAAERLVLAEASNTDPVISAPGPSADPDPVTGATTVVSVTANDPDDDPLTYHWSLASGPASVVFAPNDSGAASSSTATFQAVGDYTLQVVVSDDRGGSTAATVDVTVTATPTSIVIAP